jgi:hypothetical protein
MTNTFAPAAVARAVELILRGETNPRRRIVAEFPQLTRAGVDRVIDLAWQAVVGQDQTTQGGAT